MSDTVTLWKPAVWTAAITARSRRSRCASRTSSAGSPLRPRGRPRSPSWVPASSPSCLTSGHAPTMSSVLKYAIVLLRPLGSPDRRALRGPHERDYSRTSHRPQRGVVAVAAPTPHPPGHRSPGHLPGHHWAGHDHALLRAVRGWLCIPVHPRQPAHELHVLRADPGLRGAYRGVGIAVRRAHRPVRPGQPGGVRTAVHRGIRGLRPTDRDEQMELYDLRLHHRVRGGRLPGGTRRAVP